ncbi:hypothetical protein [Sphingosinicella rhizophila]|uniref:Zinc ribbon domain-containing protein n=1 Tax=Sphingosinicella rhizophila TaxID=3050082 RepID=A0ABU3Q899_9SPHN|nr:hypothetical protein [Sphingosinicella sp. GR2756]MDT9599632.1 hypothetical protein [Sphingosinicella sp. GR2756]
MNLVCSNCGKREGPTATYCRDCYTVFPFEARAAAQRGRERRDSLGAWKWLPVLALVAGGVIFTRLDFEAPPPPEEEMPEPVATQSAPAKHRPPRTFGDADQAWSTLKEHAPTPGAGGGRARQARVRGAGKQAEKFAIAPSIAAASQYVGWVLGSDTELACPSVRPCPATISFGSGDQGSYAVERWEGTSNNVVPADARASRLLNRNFSGTMKMKLPEGRVRSVEIEKRASRWSFSGSGDS